MPENSGNLLQNVQVLYLVGVLGECVHALLGGHLPDLDGAVRGARDEVLVVGREGHAQHPARVPGQRRDQAPVTPRTERNHGE